MGSPRRTVVCCAALLACAVPGAASATPARIQAPEVAYIGPGPNFTVAHRQPTQIRLIVIHVTEGSFWGTIAWLRNPLAHGSANFVVSRTGQIAELVPPKDIAWHAGNWLVNTQSIGIEHEGVTADLAGFTFPEYRASARLTAYLARKSLLPIDRKHIIGHSEVPDPFDPSAGGGIDNHTDPGPYWHWRDYLRLVRRFAYPRKPHIGLHVGSATLHDGQTVRATVPVRARVRGPVRRVDFLVDGRLRSRDTTKPFVFRGGWHTRRFPNGRHRVELRAYGPRGSWTRERLVVRVRNLAFDLDFSGVRRNAVVAGVVRPAGTITGAPARRIELKVDGKRVGRATRSPFVFTWDTRLVGNGRHVLAIRAWSRDGRRAEESLPVIVLNAAPPEVLAQSLTDGQTVSGSVTWEATVRGSVARVEFLVDGAVRATATAAPFAYAWDTAAEAPGPHELLLRAVGVDGTTVERSLAVTVNPPPASPPGAPPGP